jgi:hypothetical protein
MPAGFKERLSITSASFNFQEKSGRLKTFAVASGILPDVEGAHPAARISPGFDTDYTDCPELQKQISA